MKFAVILTTGIAGGLAVGSALGYLIAQKRLSHQFDEILSKEIEEAKNYYKTLYKAEEFQTPESTAKALGVDVEESNRLRLAVQAMRNYNGLEPVGNGKRANIFETVVTSEELGEEEIRNRTEEAAYVISKDEYFQGEKNYVQVSMSYFQSDEVLVDEREQPVDDVDDTVGLNNLQRFGQGSKDPNVVYVRNDALELDFEILKSEGSYSKDVLGLG